VCGDFAFYQFPTDDFWRKLFARVPAGFRFAFKAPEQITCQVFPTHPRYGSQGGKKNQMFLDSPAITDMFLRPLLPYRDKTALVILEFGSMRAGSPSREAAVLAEFLDRLDPFLAALPPDFRYAVEI